MFSQHFIEGIFHFNSYSKHKSYNKFSQSDRCCTDHTAAAAAASSPSPSPHIPLLLVCREKVRFSLKGAQHREKRFRIYRFLLENFTDVQRFNVSNKINQTVLGENRVHVLLSFGFINDDSDVPRSSDLLSWLLMVFMQHVFMSNYTFRRHLFSSVQPSDQTCFSVFASPSHSFFS